MGLVDEAGCPGRTRQEMSGTTVLPGGSDSGTFLVPRGPGPEEAEPAQGTMQGKGAKHEESTFYRDQGRSAGC